MKERFIVSLLGVVLLLFGLVYSVSAINPCDKIGVYQNHTWYVDYSGNGTWEGTPIDKIFEFGMAGDAPVTGDWNGDGITEIGVVRGSHTWYLDYNGNGTWDGALTDRIYGLGQPGDAFVTGDWNGDGTTEIGVVRGRHTWYLDDNGNGTWDGTPTDIIMGLGQPGDVPVTGDWNGNGTTKIGVWRGGHDWYLDYYGNGTWVPGMGVLYGLGQPGDIPVTGDWNDDRITEIGVFRGGHDWYLDFNRSGTWEGDVTDRHFGFGQTGWIPVTGKWIPNAPTANFTSNFQNGVAPLTVMFTDQSTNTPTSWKWEYETGTGSWTEFGSGAQNPSNTFSTGIYDIRLNATNAGGSTTKTKSEYITVNDPVSPPVAGFTANRTSGNSPLAIRFTDQSTNTPTSWKWEYKTGSGSWTEFGSGAQNPSNTFSTGIYDIRLNATNVGGSTTKTKSEYINVTLPGSSNAGIALTFDDNSIDDWYAIRNILQSNNAHATFFVSNFGDLSPDQINKLKLLQDDGNEIAFHGLNHLDAVIYLNTHSITDYMNVEIIPGITLMKNNGFNPVDFAYPYGHDNAALDQALHAYFVHTRDTGGLSEPMYYQYGSTPPHIDSIGIDDTTYGVTMTDIQNLIDGAKNQDKIIIFYGHRTVASNPMESETSYDRIEKILQYVSDNNLKTFTISEML